MCVHFLSLIAKLTMDYIMEYINRSLIYSKNKNELNRRNVVKPNCMGCTGILHFLS